MSESMKNKSRNEKIDALIAGLDDQLLTLHHFPKKNKELPNILPPVDVDFEPYVQNIIDPSMPDPQHKRRANIVTHYESIRYSLKGKPELFGLLVLCIAYMRRHPDFLDHAATLFFRIIDEHEDLIVENIGIRYTVSILRTLAEFGRTDVEKLTALNGFTYISLVRAYESERAIDGLDNGRATFTLPVKGNSAAGRGLSFQPARDGALSILNALILNNALKKETMSGKLTISLLLQVRENNNIFIRIDKALYDLPGSEKKAFAWSFGRPKDKR